VATESAVFVIDVLRGHHGKPPSCASNLKQVALAAFMYSSDNDGRFPSSTSWCDGLYPYIRSPRPLSEHGGSSYAYAYSDLMDRARDADIVHPELEWLLFDSRVSTRNAHGPIALADPRHDRGSNIAFADGHVKWLRDAEAWRERELARRFGK
jgi:prepilin-type processing-associated H-X9-DG protein